MPIRESQRADMNAVGGAPDGSATIGRPSIAAGGQAMFIAFLLTTMLTAEAEAAVTPGLHVAAGQVLPARQQRLQLQATLQENYPHFEAVHAQGIADRFETKLQGLFRHARVSGLGDEYRYDSDQLEAGLRWQLARGGRRGLALVPAGGYSRISERHRYSDGRRAASASRYYWAELSATTSLANGLVLAAVGRGLREIGPDTDTTATILSLALPRINHMTLLGDIGMFADNPCGWRKPWATGVRMTYEKHNLFIYLSNTWGTTLPASLAGTDMLFYNLRVALNM